MNKKAVLILTLLTTSHTVLCSNFIDHLKAGLKDLNTNRSFYTIHAIATVGVTHLSNNISSSNLTWKQQACIATCAAGINVLSQLAVNTYRAKNDAIQEPETQKNESMSPEFLKNLVSYVAVPVAVNARYGNGNFNLFYPICVTTVGCIVDSFAQKKLSR